jgi:putative ABC transport system permease protein
VRDLAYGLSLWLVDGAAAIVPGPRREDWRREWSAEFWHRREEIDARGESGPAVSLDLLWRAAGAFVHAFWLRAHEWRLEMVVQDLRYAVRTFLRTPGVTAAAVLTLGLGIAANVVVFSAVNGALLRPYPYPEADRLAVVVNTHPDRPGQPLPLAYPDIEAVAETGLFEAVGGVDWEPFNLRLDSRTEWVGGGRVNAGAFQAFGLPMVAGRGLFPDDDVPGAGAVTVLSEGLWRSAFGANPDVVGTSVRLDGVPHEVVGVVAAGLSVPDGARLWVPLRPEGAGATRQSRWLQVYGRLADGTTWEQANAELGRLAASLAEAHPDTNEGRGLEVVPLREARTDEIRPALLLLLGAVGLLLLIVCANLASLLLARASTRRRELGVRLAIGASRTRLARQLLTESLVLAVGGFVVGLVVGSWGAGALARLVPEQPAWLDPGLDLRVVLFAAGLSAVAGLLFGILPAVQGPLGDLTGALGAVVRGGPGRREGVRSALVLAEVALSVVLLIGAGLMVRSFVEVSGVDTGFEPAGRVVATLQLSGDRYEDGDAVRGLSDRLLAGLLARPEVEAAGIVDRFPLSGSYNSVGWWESTQTADEYESNPQALLASVSPGYFEAMGIRVLSGRAIREGDRPGAPDVVVVSETFAREHWGDGEAVGRRISFRYPARFVEVVGVVEDVKHTGLIEGPRYQMYASLDQFPASRLSVAVHAPMAEAAVAGTIRRVVRELDPDLAVSAIRPLDDIAASAMWPWRVLSQLFWLFGGFAALLAAVGIYGVVSYAVSRRTREIGVRIALGAGPVQVTRLVARRVGMVVVVGLVLGIGAALVVGRAAEGLLFGVSPRDPATFVAVALGFSAIAAVAAFGPTRRALRIDPARALRDE